MNPAAPDPSRLETPEAAEAAFYAAFEQGALDRMMAVWAEDTEVECVHPLGERLRERGAIRESWRAIFADAPGLAIRIEQRQSFRSEALAVHVVHEHIGVGTVSRTPIVATNVYVRQAGGWRMVLHHASPVRPPRPQPPPPTGPLH